MNIFEYDSYKAFLKSHIETHRRPGLIAELAKIAGCDRTYLSQVLNGKVHLTSDHAINLAESMGLSEAEQNYFLLMVLNDRAASAEAKDRLKKKMQKLADENLVLTKKIKSREIPGELPEELKAKYYSSWYFGAIHILTCIPEYQSIEAISRLLKMDRKHIEEVLLKLVEMKLVEKSGERFLHTGNNLHIPSYSPLTSINHLNWRLRGVEKSSADAGIHYTTTFAVSAKDTQRLRSQLLDFIEKQRSMIHKSGSEEVFTFCCDLYSPI